MVQILSRLKNPWVHLLPTDLLLLTEVICGAGFPFRVFSSWGRGHPSSASWSETTEISSARGTAPNQNISFHLCLWGGLSAWCNLIWEGISLTFGTGAALMEIQKAQLGCRARPVLTINVGLTPGAFSGAQLLQQTLPKPSLACRLWHCFLQNKGIGLVWGGFSRGAIKTGKTIRWRKLLPSMSDGIVASLQWLWSSAIIK